MTVAVEGAAGRAGVPSGGPGLTIWLGGRFRLDERVTAAGGLSVGQGSLWRATDALLYRPVAIHLLSRGVRVPAHVMAAVQAAARVNDPRLATIYDTDYDIEGPYIVSEWTPGTHLEDLVLSGLPSPALAAAMIADAADALAVAHPAGRLHLCLSPRSLRWDTGSGLKITGLGIDAALSGRAPPIRPRPRRPDHGAGRDALRPATGCWPGDEPTAPPACTPVPPARVHPAAGPGRGARRPGSDHLPRPAASGEFGGAQPGRAGRGPAGGAAAVELTAAVLTSSGRGRARAASGPGSGHGVPAESPVREEPRRSPASYDAAAPGGVVAGLPGGEERADRSWPRAINSVGSRGPVSLPMSKWYSSDEPGPLAFLQFLGWAGR